MKYKSLIFLIIGLLILGIMLWFIGIDQIIAAIQLANIWLILLAIAIQGLVYVLYSIRWQIINKIGNIDVGVKKLLPMIVVGLTISNLTPSGRTGGEPVKAYMLSKEANVPLEETFATVISDKLLDTFPFIVLALISIIAVAISASLPFWIMGIMVIGIIFISIILIFLIYMSFNENFANKIVDWCVRIVKKFYKKNPEKTELKVREIIIGFQKTMALMISHKNVLYYALPLSFVTWVIEILRVYIVFLAFGFNISPLLIGEIFIIASLIGMVPLLPGGLGAVDGVMILFFATVGIPPSISAAATVIERLISFWLVTIAGTLILPFYGSSVMKKISSVETGEENPVEDIEDELTYISHENESKKD